MTDEHLKQIGRVVVNFSTLEINLSLITWGLISNYQQIGRAVTSGMPFNALSNMFATLCKVSISSSEDLKTLENITKRINEINVRRNQIVHSLWLTDPDSTKVSRLKIKADGFKGIKQTSEDMSSEDVKKLADDIRILVDDLNKLYALLRSPFQTTD